MWVLLAMFWTGSCASITQHPDPSKRLPQNDLIHISGCADDDVLAWDLRVASSRALQAINTHWGQLTQPVHIVVHPSHHALEQALGKHDLPWLRAWARFDRIDLQSPKTFGYSQGYEDALTELLRHELTHVWTYQHIGNRETWSQAWLPFWFREGMASWTAKQGYRRGTYASLGRRLSSLRTSYDPLLDAEALNRVDQPLAYGAAHWAFTLLVQEQGTLAVRKIIDAINKNLRCRTALAEHNKKEKKSAGDNQRQRDCSTEGSGFAQAFAQFIGESETAFAKRFTQKLLNAAQQSDT